MRNFTLFSCIFLSSLSFANESECYGDNAWQDLQRRIIQPHSWGALPIRCALTEDLKKEKFVVHHTATRIPSHGQNATNIVQDIQRIHQLTRKWCDIGYHFLIGVDGEIYATRRGVKTMGAHAYGHNRHSIGAAFVGCFDTRECGHGDTPYGPHEVTREMLEAMEDLAGAVAEEWGFEANKATVLGHRELPAATACPGDLVLERMDEIRNFSR